MMYQFQGYGYASSNALVILIPPIIRTMEILVPHLNNIPSHDTYHNKYKLIVSQTT